jgi:hypothetical protein
MQTQQVQKPNPLANADVIRVTVKTTMEKSKAPNASKRDGAKQKASYQFHVCGLEVGIWKLDGQKSELADSATGDLSQKWSCRHRHGV